MQISSVHGVLGDSVQLPGKEGRIGLKVGELTCREFVDRYEVEMKIKNTSKEEEPERENVVVKMKLDVEFPSSDVGNDLVKTRVKITLSDKRKRWFSNHFVSLVQQLF